MFQLNLNLSSTQQINLPLGGKKTRTAFLIITRETIRVKKKKTKTNIREFWEMKERAENSRVKNR